MYLHIKNRNRKNFAEMKKYEAGLELKNWMLSTNYSIKQNFTPTTECEADFELNSLDFDNNYWERMKVEIIKKNEFSIN